MFVRVAAVAGVLIVIALLILSGRYVGVGEAMRFTDDLEHFKYGSIGAEVDGYPYKVWMALPVIFKDRLPGGYESFGFHREPSHTLPVGISVRRYGIDRVGFNCATCHSTTVDGGAIIPGAPAVRLDLQAYVDFLLQASVDKRFDADAIFEALSTLNEPLGLIDRLVYRWVIIPQIRRQASSVIEDNSWMTTRPRFGPGRTDAGNPWRFRFGMHPKDDDTIATVDFPSLWNQGIRQSAWLHWDGNNNSLQERNLSAALAGGARADSLDFKSIARVEDWSLNAPPPLYPFDVDTALASRGAQIYAGSGCIECHDKGGASYGGTTPIAEVGTDRKRLDAFSNELLRNFGSVGKGTPWQFSHYRKSDGYANSPLDGIWARAPYLHNGSVPNLYSLLAAPGARPARFYRGCDEYNSEMVGFDCESGFLYDTAMPGNGNGGHEYGTTLPGSDKRALLEYLKTL